MGFNKIILPEVEKLKEQLSEVGELEFTRYWKNRFYIIFFHSISG